MAYRTAGIFRGELMLLQSSFKTIGKNLIRIRLYGVYNMYQERILSTGRKRKSV